MTEIVVIIGVKRHVSTCTALPGVQIILSRLELHPLQRIGRQMPHRKLGRICS